jgi:hypothetical protein
MHARVSTYRGRSEQIDEGIRRVREDLLPRVQELDGYRGVYLLVDRRSGKSMTVTLWGGEQAMRDSEEAASRLRGDHAEVTGATVGEVERYEVALVDPQG